MSQSPLRVALTETCNVYGPMPAKTADLKDLAGRLEDLRRANVAHHVDLIRAATARGAGIVGLGELFSAPYFALHSPDPLQAALWQELAEDARDGPTVLELCALAHAEKVILVAPIFELDPASGQRFNTAVLIDEKGEVIGKYRKTHIPSDANEEASFDESLFYGPSDGLLRNAAPPNISNSPHFPVFQTSRGRIAVAICYDRHFPGVMASLAENGAELVFAPAVTFGTQSRRLWELEFEVDAARHGIFIAGSNRKGSEAPWNQEFFGASYFAGPSGRPELLDAPAGLVMADLDLDGSADCGGSGWDLKRDRRPEIYAAR
jgi:beta-ureidopropionase